MDGFVGIGMAVGLRMALVKCGRERVEAGLRYRAILHAHVHLLDTSHFFVADWRGIYIYETARQTPVTEPPEIPDIQTMIESATQRISMRTHETPPAQTPLPVVGNKACSNAVPGGCENIL